MQEAAIFDMDGTLCDVRSIRHYVQYKPNHRNFHKFHGESINCPAYPEVKELFLKLQQQGLAMLVVTARTPDASMLTGEPVRSLILTTFGRPGYLRRALDAGASGFMVKDTSASQLAEGIRRVNMGLTVVDPSLAADSLLHGESPLTERETEILRATRDGATARQIGATLFLSPGTVRNHLSSAMAKLNASNRQEALNIAADSGWL